VISRSPWRSIAMVLAPLPFPYRSGTIQLGMRGDAGQEGVVHNRCHISMSLEITTE